MNPDRERAMGGFRVESGAVCLWKFLCIGPLWVLRANSARTWTGWKDYVVSHRPRKVMDPAEMWMPVCHPSPSMAAGTCSTWLTWELKLPPSNRILVLSSKVTCSQASAGEPRSGQQVSVRSGVTCAGHRAAHIPQAPLNHTLNNVLLL